jgi:hypothetical protein
MVVFTLEGVIAQFDENIGPTMRPRIRSIDFAFMTLGLINDSVVVWVYGHLILILFFVVMMCTWNPAGLNTFQSIGLVLIAK